ncbi:hypothetical protein CEUSTIGMA_g4499.t1 [Chlamydomonas eustigma]|uniref:Uncharacterized protein n=1 Tax=Chlamydomonas eustigma TaxID=1157962 RepID=A0A250X1U1_9CHLO|nr:hypothetical protein CEUSTIGMA_g4499.t1 [Chlamydomonas eustigma]|eukprot:GAX77053.1 hypothetical protein CEUSTIGMA_g4499.t1 [Chlamydomonas eustigma]
MMTHRSSVSSSTYRAASHHHYQQRDSRPDDPMELGAISIERHHQSNRFVSNRSATPGPSHRRSTTPAPPPRTSTAGLTKLTDADRTDAQKMRLAQQSRLKELRSHQRLNAVIRARQYRQSVEKASKIMRLKLAEEAEEERVQELRQVQDQLHVQLQGIGQAQQEAAQFMTEQELQQYNQSMRRAELEAAQNLRQRAALQRARDEIQARKEKLNVVRAVRGAILMSEREKARAMGELHAELAEVKIEEQQRLAALQEERKRTGSPDPVDFRFTRIHEGPAALPGFRASSPPSGGWGGGEVHDPFKEAVETQTRLEVRRDQKVKEAAKAMARAQERFKAARAKVLAERELQKFQEDLEEAEAEELERRKKAIVENRGPLVNQRKQLEMERMFEDNFLAPPPVPPAHPASNTEGGRADINSSSVHHPLSVPYITFSMFPMKEQQTAAAAAPFTNKVTVEPLEQHDSSGEVMMLIQPGKTAMMNSQQQATAGGRRLDVSDQQPRALPSFLKQVVHNCTSSTNADGNKELNTCAAASQPPQVKQAAGSRGTIVMVKAAGSKSRRPQPSPPDLRMPAQLAPHSRENQSAQFERRKQSKRAPGAKPGSVAAPPAVAAATASGSETAASSSLHPTMVLPDLPFLPPPEWTHGRTARLGRRELLEAALAEHYNKRYSSKQAGNNTGSSTTIPASGIPLPTIITSSPATHQPTAEQLNQMQLRLLVPDYHEHAMVNNLPTSYQGAPPLQTGDRADSASAAAAAAVAKTVPLPAPPVQQQQYNLTPRHWQEELQQQQLRTGMATMSAQPQSEATQAVAEATAYFIRRLQQGPPPPLALEQRGVVVRALQLMNPNSSNLPLLVGDNRMLPASTSVLTAVPTVPPSAAAAAAAVGRPGTTDYIDAERDEETLHQEISATQLQVADAVPSSIPSSSAALPLPSADAKTLLMSEPCEVVPQKQQTVEAKGPSSSLAVMMTGDLQLNMLLDPESDVFEQEVDRQLGIMMQQLGLNKMPSNHDKRDDQMLRMQQAHSSSATTSAAGALSHDVHYEALRKVASATEGPAAASARINKEISAGHGVGLPTSNSNSSSLVVQTAAMDDDRDPPSATTSFSGSVDYFADLNALLEAYPLPGGDLPYEKSGSADENARATQNSSSSLLSSRRRRPTTSGLSTAATATSSHHEGLLPTFLDNSDELLSPSLTQRQGTRSQLAASGLTSSSAAGGAHKRTPASTTTAAWTLEATGSGTYSTSSVSSSIDRLLYSALLSEGLTSPSPYSAGAVRHAPANSDAGRPKQRNLIGGRMLDAGTAAGTHYISSPLSSIETGSLRLSMDSLASTDLIMNRQQGTAAGQGSRMGRITVGPSGGPQPTLLTSSSSRRTASQDGGHDGYDDRYDSSAALLDGSSSIISELSELAKEGEQLAVRITAAMQAPSSRHRLWEPYLHGSSSSSRRKQQQQAFAVEVSKATMVPHPITASSSAAAVAWRHAAAAPAEPLAQVASSSSKDSRLLAGGGGYHLAEDFEEKVRQSMQRLGLHDPNTAAAIVSRDDSSPPSHHLPEASTDEKDDSSAPPLYHLPEASTDDSSAPPSHHLPEASTDEKDDSSAPPPHHLPEPSTDDSSAPPSHHLPEASTDEKDDSSAPPPHHLPEPSTDDSSAPPSHHLPEASTDGASLGSFSADAESITMLQTQQLFTQHNTSAAAAAMVSNMNTEAFPNSSQAAPSDTRTSAYLATEGTSQLAARVPEAVTAAAAAAHSSVLPAHGYFAQTATPAVDASAAAKPAASAATPAAAPAQIQGTTVRIKLTGPPTIMQSSERLTSTTTPRPPALFASESLAQAMLRNTVAQYSQAVQHNNTAHVAPSSTSTQFNYKQQAVQAAPTAVPIFSSEGGLSSSSGRAGLDSSSQALSDILDLSLSSIHSGGGAEPSQSLSALLLTHQGAQGSSSSRQLSREASQAPATTATAASTAARISSYALVEDMIVDTRKRMNSGGSVTSAAAAAEVWNLQDLMPGAASTSYSAAPASPAVVVPQQEGMTSALGARTASSWLQPSSLQHPPASSWLQPSSLQHPPVASSSTAWPQSAAGAALQFDTSAAAGADYEGLFHIASDASTSQMLSEILDMSLQLDDEYDGLGNYNGSSSSILSPILEEQGMKKEYYYVSGSSRPAAAVPRADESDDDNDAIQRKQYRDEKYEGGARSREFIVTDVDDDADYEEEWVDHEGEQAGSSSQQADGQVMTRSPVVWASLSGPSLMRAIEDAMQQQQPVMKRSSEEKHVMTMMGFDAAAVESVNEDEGSEWEEVVDDDHSGYNMSQEAHEYGAPFLENEDFELDSRLDVAAAAAAALKYGTTLSGSAAGGMTLQSSSSSWYPSSSEPMTTAAADIEGNTAGTIAAIATTSSALGEGKHELVRHEHLEHSKTQDHIIRAGPSAIMATSSGRQSQQQAMLSPSQMFGNIMATSTASPAAAAAGPAAAAAGSDDQYHLVHHLLQSRQQPYVVMPLPQPVEASSSTKHYDHQPAGTSSLGIMPATATAHPSGGSSVASSLDSDGFADVMSVLLRDINQGLAAMAGRANYNSDNNSGTSTVLEREPSFGESLY